MKRGALIAIVAHMAAVGMTAGQAQGRQQEPRITAFVNVNVIPMDEERVLRNYTGVVEQGRIMEMGPAGSVTVPANAQRIDGSGKYLMPGLAEMHGHTPNGPFAETVMFRYVANGITTVRGLLGLGGASQTVWPRKVVAIGSSHRERQSARSFMESRPPCSWQNLTMAWAVSPW